MEKHSAYCALMRLGMNVPETVLVPYKNPVDNARWAYTSARYNREFDLDAVAESLGYPLFMKPFDGGGWRGVSMVRDREDLHRAYDDSGEMLMHLQQSVAGYDVFARALTIGPETMVMKFRPDEPMHQPVRRVARLPRRRRWARRRSPSPRPSTRSSAGSSTPARCSSSDGVVYPIDYANACPDVAVTSLHYYFPWAIDGPAEVVGLLPRHRAQGAHPGRHRTRGSRSPTTTASTTAASSRRTSAWRTSYFDLERYQEFCAPALPHVDEMVLDWVQSPEFDQMLASTVATTYPAHEHEQFLAHFRGLIDLWVDDESARLGA